MSKALFQVVCFAVSPVNASRTDPFWAYANLTVASFKLQQPDVRAILLTVRKVKIPSGLLFDKVQRSGDGKFVSQGLMMDELKCWLNFVKSDLFDRPTVLIDPDLLYQHDLFPIFSKHFDIGLTWRDVSGVAEPTSIGEAYKNHPFNAGVIFLNPKRKTKVIDFFENCVAKLKSMDEELWNWYGDQEAILWSSGRKNNFAYQPKTWEYSGIKFESFLCENYNFSQQYVPSGEYRLQCYPSPHIVHFKGSRIKLMFQYAQEYLGIRLEPDKKAPGGVKIIT